MPISQMGKLSLDKSSSSWGLGEAVAHCIRTQAGWLQGGHLKCHLHEGRRLGSSSLDDARHFLTGSGQRPSLLKEPREVRGLRGDIGRQVVRMKSGLSLSVRGGPGASGAETAAPLGGGPAACHFPRRPIRTSNTAIPPSPGNQSRIMNVNKEHLLSPDSVPGTGLSTVTYILIGSSCPPAEVGSGLSSPFYR